MIAASTGVGLFQWVHPHAGQHRRDLGPPTSSSSMRARGVAQAEQNLGSLVALMASPRYFALRYSPWERPGGSLDYLCLRLRSCSPLERPYASCREDAGGEIAVTAVADHEDDRRVLYLLRDFE